MKDFPFQERQRTILLKNKRNDHFYYGETVGLVKDGSSCGYVNLTPAREDEGRVKDCIITRFGISSRDAMFDRVKIDDRYIASLALDELKKKRYEGYFFPLPLLAMRKIRGTNTFPSKCKLIRTDCGIDIP